MKSLALLGAVLSTLAAAAVALASPVAIGAEGPVYPFNPEGSSAALKEKIAEQFSGAAIPAEEQVLCSPGEHSMSGPVSYCLAEFRTEGTWNQVAASRQLAAVAEPGGASVSIYAHTSWRREWRRCPLGRGTPGVLFSDERCGNQQTGQLSETDGELISFEVLPKLRSGRPVRFVNRDLPFGGAAPSLSRFRASPRNGVYTFTNSVGDSFRYRSPKRLGASRH